jgi:hypothetical protein
VRERFRAKIAAAEKRIADRLPELVDSMFELAEGVTVRETDADGSPRTYTRPPDFRAASYLIDRILGKPVVAVEAEVSGPDGGPIAITAIEAVIPPGAAPKTHGERPDGDHA